ncbi:hypothetical protein JG688_00006063 [Phytophthora aleatoria]|uniref:Uncharacterized protein n=1 Tax=Phytophthora aleatoria TaxID=2496075 RepID=A0A8J5J7L1_9STRA|nr:hypothetical protein JG688_00006063 [Phytophthora aleatoria]
MSKVMSNMHKEDLRSIARNLDIDKWEIGGIALDIRLVESDFPEGFYVRMETLDIIKIFNEFMKRKLSTVFVG